jgi:hypothetical protein
MIEPEDLVSAFQIFETEKLHSGKPLAQPFQRLVSRLYGVRFW